MIRFVSGNLLNTTAEAVVNPVNCVGVMGAGLAKQFKMKYRRNFLSYHAACKRCEVKIGGMFLFDNGEGECPRYIVNFPTKVHWKDDSRLEYIHFGLKSLKVVLKDLGVSSVAIPRIGCGLGQLEWEAVRGLILRHLSDLTDIEILIYG